MSVIRPRIQWIRGMCTDEAPHVHIDVALGEVLDLLDEPGDDRRVFAFVEAQARLATAATAQAAANTEAVAAENAMHDAFDALTPDEQARVNAAYANEEHHA